MFNVLKKTSSKQAELLRLLNQGSAMPRHVAIIMDGNGRWAKKRGLPRFAGHREGVKSVQRIVEAAGELGIQFLTLYTFSKENWRRPGEEVSALMRLLASSLKKEIERLIQKNVRLQTIGDLEDLPDFVHDVIAKGIEDTHHNSGLTLNLALSYGARSEILQAVKDIALKVRDGELSLEEINNQSFSASLFTKHMPDPDLLIRTSGECRISNFLLWQLAYSEIYLTQTLWPDFCKESFYEALINYFQRERRYGMVSEQINSLSTFSASSRKTANLST